ncbi:MAG: ligase-associated DNA damage response DEXH box helicase [Elainellaceae cyanobacterium]
MAADFNASLDASPNATLNIDLSPVLDWFDRQSWQPLEFQRRTWQAYGAGHSGLIQVPTGSGKTYGAVMGPIARMLSAPGKGLRLLYITPLRSLSRDIEQSLRGPIDAMGWPLTVESRTGDTSSYRKSRQLKTMPHILITTPESLAVMLSYNGAMGRFAALETVILDEWHELLSTKRGTQMELCLSYLRHLRPQLQTWAISATLGNLQEAAQAAVGQDSTPTIIQANLQRDTIIRSVLPHHIDTFPWAGHLGLRMFQELVDALDIEASTLIFTNTRSQAERWYQALQYALPDHSDRIALHHGSIDAKARSAIESGVKTGEIKWVVCTSSLDLGVDFQPVERVVQVGSAKNLARLLQRAGRSAHVPEGTSELVFLPTNALELLEISAFRRGLAAGAIESRRPLQLPYDVLVPHMVTLACGDGFEPQAVLQQVRQTAAFAALSDEAFAWVLLFIEQGGKCLSAYPHYRKVINTDGRYHIADAKLARMHRLSIGTITSNALLRIAYTNRKAIGTVEENFVSRLKPGDVFFFAGRQLEFWRMRDMVVYVRNTRRKSTVTPTWRGGSLAFSHTLSTYLRQEIDAARNSPLGNDELACVSPILETQAVLSHLPAKDELLIETCQTREGQHLYVFPLEGRAVHEGLGFLWGYRFAQLQQATFTISVNDYGFEILAPKGYPFQDLFSSRFFDRDTLQGDVKAALNISELTQRRFRGIAQVAGLVFKGYPSSRKTASQLQVSSSLLHEVFCKYEPDNLLLRQAEQEVLQQQLDGDRLAQTLERLQGFTVVWQQTRRPSPLAFPLLVERLSSKLSNESLMQRIERMKQQWDKSR